ncbi:bifunctional helix-turn-helix transcriptional regulator/GNAT family N-acetyltransferase [Flavobacterium sp. F-65]|jgi:DNA-binding MarR family transcriptional regulator/N-acetylglutamate synthase-like GNAT family acetyltransferase|uniref:Bifunctional helix-turn-helix transcriptional regulator/GNAT family N-acetyltransferase n=1 Tax=Flavobacterium pisciphilum TaxID=2893755 RepID=A0ABS8MQC9_9FLAO|nr:bifunctional helix-turn-helix transcriptional regulator/GNAT family N-acetyltransferase [Flavobacterium sp. F-65]MCC9070436.1 bifunctional helix-turn-helix transcriptional regulator/GNAT family N-acetyltransferase [Flavobacterium sp. F-65]
MELFNELGKVAMGSKLRIFTDRFTEDAGRIYELYNIKMQPKWFPVFYALSKGETKTITNIANEIGHSHPSVSKIISEMSKQGYVVEKKDKADGRRNIVALSAKGNEITEKIQDLYLDLNNAIEDIASQANNDLWRAIEEWQYLLDEKSLLRRVQELRKERESDKVEIIACEPKHYPAFRALNEEWISTYFKMEEADYKALDNPKEYILDKGGYIFVAIYNNEPIGVCAMLKMDDKDKNYDFEMAKMAVSPKAQGKSVGYLLGMAVIEKAKEVGATTIYLESNTILKPAISLYNKLGFKKVAGHPTPYERANIQMLLTLE